MTEFTYKVHGLVVSCDRPLSDLDKVTVSAPADIAVSIDKNLTLPQLPKDVWIDCNAADQSVLMDIPDGPAFRIFDGTTIQYDPREGGENRLRAYLLGRALGAALYQQGRFPLHASANVFGGGAVLFVGDSGAGKSTLCHALTLNGAGLVADDVCVLSPDATQLFPGVRRPKLWQDTLDEFGLSSGGLDPVEEHQGKYYLPNDTQDMPSSMPVSGVVLLEQGTCVSLSDVSREDALGLIARHSYIYTLIPEMGLGQSFLDFAIKLSNVPFYRLTRPMGFDYLDETVALLNQRF